MKKAIICSLLALLSSPCFADPMGEGAFERINIRADEAVEDDKPGVLHLKGNFQMLSQDWHLTSSLATVYGSPNKPDKIFLQGSPARFVFLPSVESEKDQIEATADTVEYIRDGNTLILTGDASLVLGGETIRSSIIEYDITTNRYQAGGDNGVIIKVLPVD
jgi:lipopolysaccharide transport protein LptA